MTQMDERALAVHVPVLGWLFILGNAFLFLMGAIGLILLVGLGIITDDPTALSMLILVGAIGAVFFAFLAIPGTVAGFGLLGRRAWARVLALVVAFFSLTAFPVGTALGAYAFYVLLQDSAHAYFGGSG